jgi:hypothetical protein
MQKLFIGLLVGICVIMFSLPLMAADSPKGIDLSTLQVLDNAELSKMQGKFLGTDGCARYFLCEVVRTFWVNKVPYEFKQSCIGQKLRAFYFKICGPQIKPTIPE